MSYRSLAPATSVACRFTMAVSPTKSQGSITPPGSTCRVAIVTSFAVQLLSLPVRSSTQVWANPEAAEANKKASPRAVRMAADITVRASTETREKH